MRRCETVLGCVTDAEIQASPEWKGWLAALAGDQRARVETLAELYAVMASAPPDAQDLILIDPPFDADLFVPALKAAVRLVAPGGWIYLEADRAFGGDDLAPLGLELGPRPHEVPARAASLSHKPHFAARLFGEGARSNLLAN